MSKKVEKDSFDGKEKTNTLTNNKFTRKVT